MTDMEKDTVPGTTETRMPAEAIQPPPVPFGFEGRPQKLWQISEQPDAAIASLVSGLGVQPLTARLLYDRGYETPEEAGPFIRKETGIFHDPFLLRDMDRAVARIEEAITAGEKITVYGDYDVDGVTSTTILYQYLRDRGADIAYYIPGRLEEGYGLSCGAVERLREDGTRLIITVDTGVTAVAEAEQIAACGMELVVTDHHACREVLPQCAAVVNPRRPDCPYPFKDLAGVGVVFKLLCALETGPEADTRTKMEATRRICLAYADYTAIGTVADVMPLRDENRLIVNVGLAMLSSTEKPGLQALIERASAPKDGETRSRYPKKRKINSAFIGFTIAPRINAAGRIARADRAVELFLTDSPLLADRIAGELCDANRERQETENRIAAEIFARIEEKERPEEDFVIVASGEGWHHGVIGIVASRITEKYHKPSIVISFEGDVGKGSGRSIPGFHLVGGISACEDLLVTYGGHAQAAGLTVTRDNLEAFTRRINDLARRAFGGVIPIPCLQVDARVQFSDLTLRAAEELFLLEPCGVGNPAPRFVLQNAHIREVTALSGGKHTRLTVCDARGEISRQALLFGTPTEAFPLRTGDCADLVFGMDINEFGGQRTVQLMVEDIRPAEGCTTALERQYTAYRLCKSGAAPLTEDAHAPCDMVPDRDACKAVYLVLRTLTDNGRHPASVSPLVLSVRAEEGLCRTCLILDILQEAGLIGRRERGPLFSDISLAAVQGKTDLSATPLAVSLRRRYCAEGT